jgi:hypothetical protein
MKNNKRKKTVFNISSLRRDVLSSAPGKVLLLRHFLDWE